MRLPIQGAWYADLTPSGEWAALIRDSHIETSRGRVPLCPGGNVLFLRLRVPSDGVLYLAGQGHQDGVAWLWNGLEWRSVTTETNGQKVCAFGPLGLYVATTGHRVEVYSLAGAYKTTAKGRDGKDIATGSGGIQYVTDDGQVVTGDSTYGHGPSVWPGVAEWSQAGDVTLGQGYSGGAIAVQGDLRVVLEPGECYFLHVCRNGSQLAVSMVTPAGAVLHWLDVSTLPSYPPESGVTLPEPQPSPEPESPMPIPDALDDQLALVRQVRHDLFPDLADAPLHDPRKAFAVTQGVAWRLRHLGIGLVAAKPGSDNNVDGYVTDVVALASGDHWDTLIDGNEGAAFPEWRKVDAEHNGPIAARWRPAVDPGGQDDPGDSNPPQLERHAYDRDDDERDECNRIMADGSQCDQPRGAAIHAVAKPPAPKQPAAPTLPPNSTQADRIEAKLDRLLSVFRV